MRVVWAASARRDLQGIWAYIARDNAAVADRVDDDIIAAGKSLAEMPRRVRPGAAQARAS